MYEAGLTLRTKCAPFWHYGISDGEGNVIHNSKKRMKVVLESLNDFADGRQVEISNIKGNDLPKALNTAKRYIGLPYDLFSDNCEHFVRLAHGLEKESTQLQQYLVLALGVGLGRSEDRYIKYIGNSVAIASLITPSEESPYKNAAIAGLIGIGLAIVSENTE